MDYKTEIRIENVEGLNEVAQKLIDSFKESRVFALNGLMGVGKTTLVKAICAYLDSFDTATSPTFSLVNEYTTPSGISIYHFDFYRLKNLEEAYNIGYEEYFYSGNYCFVEWPGIIEPLLPPDCVMVDITEEDGVRVFRF
jgi:tRNA threonylcarbamoyladenosine biosynthesis protein TsaE